MVDALASSIQPQELGRYTGPAFPYGPSVAGTLGPKSDIAVIFTSIENIIGTPVGTVPYDPTIGSYVPYLLFDLNDEVNRSLIRYYTFKDLSAQEKRIVVYGAYTQETDDHTIEVMVSFSLVGDPTGEVHSAPVPFNVKGS